MAISRVSDAGLSGIKYRRATAPSGSGIIAISTPWQRSTDWLTLPTVNVGDQTVVGLYAVYPGNANFIAFSATGAYTVDWGDGTATENIATGVQANHNYTFTTLSSSTLTSGGYRQAVVTITMQAGQTFTGLNLNLRHTQALLGAYVTGWLDLRMAGTSVSSLTPSALSPLVTHRQLQQFEYVGTSAITSLANKFNACSALGCVIGTAWTAGGTDFTNMFLNCSSLQAVPLLNTAAGTNFSGMFSGNSILQTIPLLNTATGTNFTNMFLGCASLQAIPLLNTAACTTFTGMFQSCASLRTIPLLNTAACTNFSRMFQNSTAVQTIPLLNTAACTDFTNMFLGCSSLQTIPLLNMVAGTNFTGMFSSCISLQTIPLLNMVAGTNFTQMFQSCTSLRAVPLLNTAAGTIFISMFNGCVSLQIVSLLNTAAGTDFTSMFNGCVSLQVGALSGTKKTISYSACRLSATEINNIYTNLASGVTGQTVTTSSNWGTSTSTASIATVKGWTVA